MKRTTIANISINDISLKDLLFSCDQGVLITPNVDHLMRLQSDRELYDIYNRTEWIICDSKVVQLGLKFLAKPVKEVIPGSSFFPAYYTYHKDNSDVRIFLLGAADGVANLAKENINKKVGREIVVGSHSPSFGFEKNDSECDSILDIINSSGATVLVVGVGAPKQEKWIFKYKDRLTNIKLFMALGATIDFEAGILQRAPLWMQRIGMEWLFRMFKEPKRLWKRYIVDDMPFFWLIFKEKLGIYKNPF